MTPKLTVAALLLAVVLTLVCYFVVMQMMMELAKGILQYLDAVVDLAQLS